jgi:hypothetical protein
VSEESIKAEIQSAIDQVLPPDTRRSATEWLVTAHPLGCIGHNDPKLRTRSSVWENDPTVLQAMQRQINELQDELIRLKKMLQAEPALLIQDDERETNP